MDQNNESEIIALIKDLQKQVAGLEKKIDQLSKRPAERSAHTKNYGPSARTYAGSQRYNSTDKNRYGSKNARPGRPDAKKRNDSARVAYPKKNQTYNPTGK